jgi:hypothetical protein
METKKTSNAVMAAGVICAILLALGVINLMVKPSTFGGIMILIGLAGIIGIWYHEKKS